MKKPIIVAPSILSADFARLGEEVNAVVAAGADWIHVDVMDGRFVPNLTIGPVVVEAVRHVTSEPLDVHLMIVEPERYLDAFAHAGADHLLVHCEPGATIHLHRTLSQIRDLGKVAGVVLNPGTSLTQIEEVLDLCDIILLMSVNPGFGGQSFLPSVLPKIRTLRKLCDARGLDPIIEIDGADEVQRISLDLIKGRGGALLREKIVAAASRRFIVIVDDDKLVDRLGTTGPLPVEVAQFGWQATADALERLDCRPELRRTGAGQSFLADGGHFILDCRFGSIENPVETERRINSIVGVVENGLFVGRSSAVIVASEDGVEILTSGGTVSR